MIVKKRGTGKWKMKTNIFTPMCIVYHKDTADDILSLIPLIGEK